MKVFLSFLFMFICIALGAYIVYRVQTGQSIIPSFAGAGSIVQIDDLDPRFKFVSSPTRTAAGYPRWDQINSSGAYVLRNGTAQQCNGLNNAGCYAALDLSSQNFSIDEITLGFSTGPNRTSVDVYVDDKKIATFDSNDSSYITDYRNYKLWKSPTGSITCGKHKIKLVPNQKTGTGQKAFTLDFADVKTCTPTGGGNWQKIENTDSRIDYGGNNPNHQNLPFWDVFNNAGLSGGSSHACRTDINNGCRALINLTTAFNQVSIRALKGFNATSADIYIDNQKIGEADAYKSGKGIGTTPLEFLDWTSNSFACKTHSLKIVPNGRTGQNAKSFTMDFLQVMSCTPGQNDQSCTKDSDCKNGKKCMMDTKECRPIEKAHIGCYQNSCAYLNRKGANTDGCQSIGTSCNGETPSFLACRDNACILSTVISEDDPGCLGKDAGDSCSSNIPPPPPSDETEYLVCQNNACALSSTVSSNDPSCANLQSGDTCGVPDSELDCQGNTDAPARCFDCKRDSSTANGSSEINILDFSCFAKFYGKEVGKN